MEVQPRWYLADLDDLFKGNPSTTMVTQSKLLTSAGPPAEQYASQAAFTDGYHYKWKGKWLFFFFNCFVVCNIHTEMLWFSSKQWQIGVFEA